MSKLNYKWLGHPKWYWNSVERRDGTDSKTERAAFEWWKSGHDPDTLSIETHISPCDKYEIRHFAQDDPERFRELVSYLNPRDQELILSYAYLQKDLTSLSILFGKAGHRAEEDLHKAAHKLAGLAEFSDLPEFQRISTILRRVNLDTWGNVSFSVALWQYARSRDFSELARLTGHHGLRKQMLRVFKILHASKGREEGLLAGWILWLVDGSDPNGKGWQKRRRGSRQHKLGPTTFRTNENLEELQSGRRSSLTGGKYQGLTVQIKRKMKFILRGMK